MRFLAYVQGAVLALGACFSAAHAANVVTLSPTPQTVAAGGTVEFTVSIDFADATLGGGLQLVHATALTLDTFSFDLAFPDDPALRLVCPDALNPACAGFAGPGTLVAFGSVAGLSGAHTVGILRLSVSAGSFTVSPVEEAFGGVAGPFQPTPGSSFEPITGEPGVVTTGASVPGGSAATRSLLLLLVAGLAVRRARP